MTIKKLAPPLIIYIAIFCIAKLPAITEYMPLNEVKAGMRGVGITVFEGSVREKFQVHILGILKNVMGPQRNLIVARLDGGPLRQTGVIQGMSGSPVYVDDRLLGAISYSLGSFSTEPIAGITPIEEMIETDTTQVTARQSASVLQLPITRNSLGSFIKNMYRWTQPFALQPTDVQVFGMDSTEGARLGPLFQPIATPLSLNGFAPEVHDLLSSAFNSSGFITTIGGTAAQQQEQNSPLMPGDPVGVGLISGDLSMAGTGTVTMVDENRVYAFGHPFYNLGPSNFPMTRARVTTLLPSLAISSKIVAIGEIIGTIDQDRTTGIYGSIGPGPSMIPIRISLSSPEREMKQTFDFKVIKDRLFTPLLTYTSILSACLSWTRELGAATYEVDSTTQLSDYNDVYVNDIYSGDTALVSAATATVEPLVTLLNNQLAPVSIERIDIDITSIEQPRTARLHRVWIDAVRPRAGDRIPLKIMSHTYRGAEIVETIMIAIPKNALGMLQILVSDASQLKQQIEQEGLLLNNAASLEQIIRELNRGKRNSRLYVKLLSSMPGAVINGETLPALPSSVLAIMESDLSNSGALRLSQATLDEWQIQTDYAVSGSRSITINVEAQ